MSTNSFSRRRGGVFLLCAIPFALQLSLRAQSWSIEDAVDPTTGQHRPAGSFTQLLAGSPEKLQVQASCDATGMHWLVVYASGTNPAGGFKQNAARADVPSPTPNVGGTGGLIARLDVGVGNLVKSHLPWTSAVVQMDDHAPVTVPAPGEDPRYARLDFLSQGVVNGNSSPADRISSDLNTISAGVNPSAGLMDQLVKANNVTIILQRADGSPIYLKMNPQDAGFRNLVTRCTQPRFDDRLHELAAEQMMQEARQMQSEGRYDVAKMDCPAGSQAPTDNKEAAICVTGAEFVQRERSGGVIPPIPFTIRLYSGKVPMTRSRVSMWRLMLMRLATPTPPVHSSKANSNAGSASSGSKLSPGDGRFR